MLLFSHMLPLAAAIDPPAYYAPGPLNIENPLLWPNPADMPAGVAAVLPEERATQAAVHYAFSTGCEVQHDWQSLGVFYSARKAAPYSNITRLVSCYHASNAKEDGHDWPAPNGMKFNDDTIIATQVTGGEDAANTKGSAAGVDEKLKRSLYSLPERRAVLCAAMRLDPAAQGDQAWPAREAEGRLLELSVGKFVAAVQL